MAPGVYLMRDSAGDILYVGKARNLRQRVSGYFGNSDARPQVRFLMARVSAIEFTVTDTEKEALLLENILIKQHHPRYNLNLKDDKTYFSLRIDIEEPFPRFTIVRKLQKDRARYFGPYSSSAAAREVIRQIQRIFPLRHYPWKNCKRRERPCLYHQIGQCSAPCNNRISQHDYQQLVNSSILFLEGKSKDLVNDFKQKMLSAAEQMQYEEAGRWRDLIRAVETTLEPQKMVRQGGDADVLGLSRSGEKLVIALLFVRSGCISGSATLYGSGELDDVSALAAFIQSYYTKGRMIPEELLLPLMPEDAPLLEELLGEQKGRRVRLLKPERGAKLEMVLLAEKNAQAAQAEQRTSEDKMAVLEDLRQKIGLERLPRKMECYDISNLQGSYAVGSGVAFTDGRPDKGLYRRYRIKTVSGQDDFAMLKETFCRRFSAERVAEWGVPDLVVVDGGIGQLNSVVAALEEIGMYGRFGLISLAKSRVKGNGKDKDVVRTEERVFLPGRRNPVRMRQDSPGLKMLAAIRDEAHRFAIEYHRKLRNKNALESSLRQIPGIGPKLERLLLTRFGSLEGLRQATIEELTSVSGIGENTAREILAISAKQLAPQ